MEGLGNANPDCQTFEEAWHRLQFGYSTCLKKIQHRNSNKQEETAQEEPVTSIILLRAFTVYEGHQDVPIYGKLHIHDILIHKPLSL